MEIYVNISFICMCSVLFRFSGIILSDALILLTSQHQTQQVMTSRISLLIIFLCSLCSRNWL